MKIIKTYSKKVIISTVVYVTSTIFSTLLINILNRSSILILFFINLLLFLILLNLIKNVFNYTNALFAYICANYIGIFMSLSSVFLIRNGYIKDKFIEPVKTLIPNNIFQSYFSGDPGEIWRIGLFFFILNTFFLIIVLIWNSIKKIN